MYCFVYEKLNIFFDMLYVIIKKKSMCYFFIVNIDYLGVEVGIFYRIVFYFVFIKFIVILKIVKNWM